MKNYLLLLCLFLACSCSTEPEKPNFVIINVDDLGWNDVDIYSDIRSPYNTPNISKLASDGMVFTAAYAPCPVCSPSRASIVTGRTPAAVDITAHIPGDPKYVLKRVPKDSKVTPPGFKFELPLSEITFAEVLKKRGYSTAFIGKWHLAGAGSYVKADLEGAVAPQFHPDKQGFDINIGGSAYGQPASYFAPYRNAMLKDGEKGEYLTDRLTDEAITVIENGVKDEKPFLLYLNYYTVHTPLQAKKDVVAEMMSKYDNKKIATYAAMISSLDENVGRILEKISSQGIENNTVILFTSDNGGVQSNAPLRSSKGTIFEGGIRVPQIVKYPPIVKPGTSSDTPVIGYDIFPTIISMASATDLVDWDIDGVDMLPILKGSDLDERAIYWHYPHYHHGYGDMASAVRVGDWKYIYFFNTKLFHLYNLKDDPSEKDDLAEKFPKRVEEMHKSLFDYLKSVDAGMPTYR